MERGVAIITGASRGIGEAVAIDLAKENFAVGLAGRDEERLKAVAAECEKLGVRARYYIVDLEDANSLEKLAAGVAKDLGGINILVNNAGVWVEKNIREASIEEWDKTIDVNLRSVFALTKAVLPYLEKEKSAAIINIGSVSSRHSYAGGTMYAASKHGLLGFGNSLFHDVREQGIKVCTLLPGYVNTAMHAGDVKLDQDLMIQPSDIAKAVSFVVNFPENACPTEITILPQKSPRLGR
jgi:NADP-dependent 3-hydroxy acid dehydrogenase YdfG